MNSSSLIGNIPYMIDRDLPIPAQQALYAFYKLEENFDAEVQRHLNIAQQSDAYKTVGYFVDELGLTKGEQPSRATITLDIGRLFIPHRNRFNRLIPFFGNIDTWYGGIRLEPHLDNPNAYDMFGVHPLNRILFSLPYLREEYTWEDAILSFPPEAQMEIFDYLMDRNLDRLELRKLDYGISIRWDKVKGSPVKNGYLDSQTIQFRYNPTALCMWRDAWKLGFNSWRASNEIPQLPGN